MYNQNAKALQVATPDMNAIRHVQKQNTKNVKPTDNQQPTTNNRLIIYLAQTNANQKKSTSLTA